MRGLPRLLAIAAALVLAACATGVPREDPGESEIRGALDAVGASDSRAAFAAQVCPSLAESGRACDAVLRAGARSDAVLVRAGAADDAMRPHLVFIAGMFAQCAARWVEAFGDSIAAFRADGYDARAIAVGGRGTALANAAQIAAALGELPRDGRPVVAFAYSKGSVDLFEALLRHPAETARIAAIVTVAGAHNGSPLAESRAELYGALGAVMPMSGCERGSGEELLDVRRDTRAAWWRAHGAAVRVPVLSLVALPRPGRLSPFIGPAARELARLDPWNDGNLLWRDAIAPRAALLGFVDADHWTIALPIARDLPFVAPLFSDDVPRPLLMRAALAIAVSKIQPPR